MIRKIRASLLGALLACGLSAGAAAAQTSVTFTATGSAQTFVVPAGVTSVQIDASGAQGFSGGLGGRATGSLVVTPGETLQINVGGAGVRATNGIVSGGGFNGGGNGLSRNDFNVAGGGGGGSDVRQGGTALTDRKIVGGGGGGAEIVFNAAAGAGGGTTGGNSAAVTTGGTQIAGGSPNGSLGQGGNQPAGPDFGGGGGGGYYGGGAAGVRSGAGGSGYIGGVTGGTLVSGTRAGAGEVILTYTAAPPAPVPTLSEWAMILFGTILAGGAALYIQRRRFTV